MDELKLFTASGNPVITLTVPAVLAKPIEVVVWNRRVFNRCNGGYYECSAFFYNDPITGTPLPKSKPCPECGYPTFKNTFEDFHRCHGCEWTSNKKL